MNVTFPPLDYPDRLPCADHPDLFTHPEGYGPGSNRDAGTRTVARETAAKIICAGCQLRAECLADAIRAGDQHTVRGGTTPSERETGGWLSRPYKVQKDGAA